MFFKRLLLSLLLSVSILGGAFGVLSMPQAVHAQGFTTGLAEIGAATNLPSGDPRVIAARIINIALGTLGIIFVILIVYAGFLYMTSGGDADKTRRAIAMIRNGIIGLIIILLSWALARYILEKLMQAAGTGGGTTTTPGGGGSIPGGGSSTSFSVKSITPNGTVPTRKVIVKVVFTKPVDPTSAAAAGMITVTKISDNSVVAGTVTTTGTIVKFIPSTPCPSPNEDRFCYEENTQYRVTISPSLRSTAGQTLTCGGFAPDCTGQFQSGSTVDITPPYVAITQPIDGFGVPIDSLVPVRALTSDNTGIADVQFSADGVAIGDDAPTGQTPISYSANVSWDTAGLALGSAHSLLARSYDVDSGVADSAPVNVIVRAQHCFNGVQDQSETGIDCGGPSTAADYCGACAGGSCTVNSDCASGVCQGGVCVDRPIITSVSPLDGAPGTYVTIQGANFGSNGTVDFLGPNGSAAVRAIPPTACSDAGITTWSPTQVVIEVPTGAKNGPIRLTNGASGLSDDTNAPPDPAIPDYIVNDTLRPGLCAIVPSQGRPGDHFTLYGTGLGSTASGIQFGSRTLVSTSWLEHQVSAAVPNVAVGSYTVSVTVGSMTSNAVSMSVLSTESGGAPSIASIDPTQGPIGTMVTISGSNFGDTVGSVFFERQGTGEIALADTSLPEACAASYWRDSSIVVKVPKEFTQVGTGAVIPGTYAVYVKTARPTAPVSNRVAFLVNTDPLAPGICSVIPHTGPVGTHVSIYGEGFTSGPATARYFSNVVDPSATWASQRASSTIPTGSESGPLTVQPAGGIVSNPYSIQVRNCNESPNACSTTETCCSDGSCMPQGVACATPPARAMYAWQFSTGIIPRAPTVLEQCSATVLPSPSPWSKRNGGDPACVNARPMVVFSTLIEPSTVTVQSGNVLLYKCSGAGADPCTSVQQNPEALSSIQLFADGNTRNGLTLVPTATLSQSTWYKVVLKTGIRGAGSNGLNMAEKAASCGTGNSYCFTFQTRGDATTCAIGSIDVAPNPYTANELNTPIAYQAIPRAQGDICQVLACEPYAWAWDTSDARATVTHNPNSNISVGGEACLQNVTPVAETGDTNPVQVTARASGTVGAGDLYIKLVPPVVTSYGPNCNEACLNAAIWAQFNVPMDPNTSIDTANVRIERCANESCQELMNPATVNLPAGSIQLTSIPNTSGTNGRFLVISPQSGGSSLLTPGSYYRVILLIRNGQGFRSASMMPLTGLNHPEGFAWIFRVKPGADSMCRPEGVSVTPVEKYEKLVGARQGFFASPFTKPDACSAQGQLLMSLSGYTWNVDDTNVARLLNYGLLDTTNIRNPGCDGKCTLTGAQGQSGKIARCGDGIVQTVSSSYCISGRTRSGATCVVLPAGSTGSEECDENSPLCNSQCLWEPVSSVSQGGTCGDGNVQADEDCDYGSVCTGAQASSNIADGTSCTRPSDRTACTNAGGKCEPKETRGCSVFCRHLGSRSGGSTCGNGDVADGEDCDDGNLTNGDGCSSNCLFEGSSKTIVSLCGNGRIEPGEICERNADGSWPAGCDQKTCLHTGTLPCAGRIPLNCCGNSQVDSGEDCDDGNTKSGDGCSTMCKYEGSSETYSTASFCGDGVQGIGEAPACEALPSRPDGLVDAYQVAETVGRAAIPANQTVMSTKIHATYDTVTGDATYGLQCGYEREDQCSSNGAIDQTVGLSDAGCCSLRPTLVSTYPLNDETNVCRNPLITGDFNTEMDTNSLSDSFVVGQQVSGSSCPSGQSLVVVERLPQPKGFKGVLVRAWNAIKVFFGGRDAYAQVVCSGGVSGRLSFSKQTASDGHVFTRFNFTLDHVLDANTRFTILFKGDPNLSDNTQKDGKKGIRTATGVVSARDWQWLFVTGDEICTIDKVEVEDSNAEHPGLFVRANEAHPFLATARSNHGGRMVPISATEEYAWNWQNWAISNIQIASLDPQVLPADALNLSLTSSTVVSKGSSGSGYVSARLIITKDSVDNPPLIGRVYQGTKVITVNTCENPWPSLSTAPFRDEVDSPNLLGTPFALGPDFYNFSMMYCRDAGDPGALGDLPSLVINAVPTNAVDAGQGILRQYLFTFSEPELKKDAIGIRIAANPLHLSPEEWYLAKGFVGKPQALTIDGYQAVRDGRTVYISAASTDGPGARIYSNIYIISYNDGAEPVTRQIYDALLSSFSFNRNIQTDVAAVCQNGSGSLAGITGAPVSCKSDVDCDAYGDGMMCANFKAKIQRDLVRLADFEKMTRLLDASKSQNGTYPKLSEGSYISGMSTSLWPSWKDALSKSTGAMPADPLNKFVTCGRCSNSNTACVKDSDCPSSGGTCQAQNGFDPQTCWNTQNLQFACAIQNTSAIPTSRIYMYQSKDNGVRYQLSSEFEVRPPNPADVTQNWWWPPLPTDVRQCVSGGLKGVFCSTDLDCRVCPNGNCTGVSTVNGSCQIVGGSYRYVDICRGETLGQSTVCGDGVLNSTETCETVGPTSYQYRSCTTSGGSWGHQRQVCNACREYVDETNSSCQAYSQCGDGVRNGFCTQGFDRPCQSNADCEANGGGVCFIWETCDDGLDNGKYGHCNKTCSGYGASCGDGMLSGGEACDLGVANTEWTPDSSSASCNLSCTGPAAYCGDKKVNQPFEVCDGNVETSTNGCPSVHVCTGQSGAGTVCNSDADCQGGAKCSATLIQTVMTRSCNAPGDANQCQWQNWSACTLPQSCGNGIKEGTEECDDGNQDNTDSCTTSCKNNTCNDGYVYKGVEECDMGSQNGQGCSYSPEYGSTCTSCSTACKFQLTQGGFCGDGKINPSSSEQCDGNDTVPAYGTGSNQLSCLALGYDYLKPGLSKIQCSQSCGYTGCAYCGDAPPVGTTDPVYQGVAEGILFDTLFQQPVPGARVTLFYRGLQVQVTNTNDRGYFKFTNLDRHDGCNQYRIVADSYEDNPLTKNFDESQRGGYMTIQTPAFSAYLDSDSGAADGYTTVMTNAQIAVRNSSYTSHVVPQFSMLPRLKEKEYIVQLWWTPRDGSPDQAIQNFRSAIGSGDTYNNEDVNAQQSSAASVYGGYENELHDLVVRTPYTYTPGAYGACSLAKKPKNYNPADPNPPTNPGGTTNYAGRNNLLYGIDSTDASLGLSNGGKNGDGSPIFTSGQFMPYTSTIPSWDPKHRDWSWKLGTDGVDQAATIDGMLSCTNKIRASAGRVCAELDASNNVVNNFGRRYGCIVDADCSASFKFNLKPANTANHIACSNSASELERTGSIQTLNGKEGAYLFCFHPEWPDGHPLRDQSQCSNFIVPPESVFIHGISGVYDILVSKFHMFQGGHSNEPRNWYGTASPAYDGNSGNALSIRTWLSQRNARIEVYDQNGLYKKYDFNTIAHRSGNTFMSGGTGSNPDQQSTWSGFDDSAHILASGGNTGGVAGNIYMRDTADQRYFQLYPIFVSTVWTPISIDTTNKQVDEWDGGDYGADYRYFSDLFMNDTGMYVSWVGNGYLPSTTAACVRWDDGTVEPNLQDGWGVCNGPNYYWSTPNSPACTDADMSVGTQGSMASMRSVVRSGTGYLGRERCTRACQSDSDCPGTSGAQNFCVPRGGCAGVAGKYTPPSR